MNEQAPAEPETAAEKPHKKRRRRWVIALSIIGAVIVVLIISAFVTAHFTSASSFCDSCHEMEPYYESWQASTHSGVECRECHIPPGPIPYIETKLGSFREIYVHFSSHPDAPLAVTRGRSPTPTASRAITRRPTPPCPPSPSPTTSTPAWTASAATCASFTRPSIRPTTRTRRPCRRCFQCHNGSIAPSDCSYCHTAPHEARGECNDCHGAKSWTGGTTEHPFPVTGAHANLACKDCHVSKQGVENIAGTSLGKADPACISCHEDKHGGLTDCGSCHAPTSWANVDFKHPLSLTGAHADLACKECHVSKPGGATVPGTQFPLPDPSCVSCHGDQHGGLTDCATCHTPTEWSNVDFEHPFALRGAHAKLSCGDCHVSTPGGTTIPGTNYPAAGKTCVSCHGKQHGGLTNCASCHTTNAWRPSTFRHPGTGGEHSSRSFACVKCHPSGYATHSCTCHGGNPPTGD